MYRIQKERKDLATFLEQVEHNFINLYEPANQVADFLEWSTAQMDEDELADYLSWNKSQLH